MSILYEYGWLLFGISEGLTWVSVLFLLITRYKYNVERLNHFFIIIIILCTLFQGLLVGVDYYYTGKISLFQVIIILFIIYASTLGNSDIQRLDKYLQQKLNKDREIFTGDLYRYIKYKNKLFFIHSIAFITLHFCWFLVDRNINLNFHEFLSYFVNHSFFYTIPNFFNHIFFNIVSYLWSIIYFFDICIFIFYFVYRKKTVNR